MRLFWERGVLFLARLFREQRQGERRRSVTNKHSQSKKREPQEGVVAAGVLFRE